MWECGISIPQSEIRFAIADYEATVSNANNAGISLDVFRTRIGKSVQSMKENFVEGMNGEEFDIEGRSINDSNSPIKDFEITFHIEGETAVKVVFGGILTLFNREIYEFNGEEDFWNQVEQKRIEFEKLAINVPGVQKKLDKLVQLRMVIMLNWSYEDAPQLAILLKNMFSKLNEEEYSVALEPVSSSSIDENVANWLNKLYGDINRFITGNQDVDKPEKEQFIKDLVFSKIKSSQAPALQKLLEYLRIKVAKQGAEYAVISELQSLSGSSIQWVADSATMWQIFGKHEVARMGIKGGYDGAN